MRDNMTSFFSVCLSEQKPRISIYIITSTLDVGQDTPLLYLN